MSDDEIFEPEPVLDVSFLICGERYECYRFPTGDEDMQLEGPSGYRRHSPNELLALILTGSYEVIIRDQEDAGLN